MEMYAKIHVPKKKEIAEGALSNLHPICDKKKYILTDLHQTLQIDSSLPDPYFLKM